MGGRNVNCKKKWHPSRYETKVKVEAAEKARDSEILRSKGFPDSQTSEQNRMDWMLPEFDDKQNRSLESRFEK